MPAAWPTTNPAYPFEEIAVKRQVRNKFEDGTVQSRVKYTRMRSQWPLRWDHMPESEYQNFKLHIEENIGGTFSWTDPTTSTAYTVRYTEGSLRSVRTIPDYRSVRVTIEEA